MELFGLWMRDLDGTPRLVDLFENELDANSDRVFHQTRNPEVTFFVESQSVIKRRSRNDFRNIAQ